MTRKFFAVLAALMLAGCATWTPTQKRVATVIAIGTIAAMAAAHSGASATESQRQFPCGCSPPPAVK